MIQIADATNVLYKYYAFKKEHEERVRKIFCDNEIYFAKPKEFNDPFDSRNCLSYEATKEQWEKWLHGWFKKNQPNLSLRQRHVEVNKCLKNRNNIPDSLGNSFLEQMGVYCMSAANNHILMWSHYSEGHSGFCLAFDINNKFFGRVQEMSYSQEYPDVNFFTSNQWEKTKACLLTKSDLWKYETEYRIIDHDEGSGVKHFPAELLTGVIIGCRMSEENTRKIIDWCADRSPRPALYKTRIKKREFGIDIFETNYLNK